VDPEPGQFCSFIYFLDAQSWFVHVGQLWFQGLLFIGLLFISFLVSGAEVAFFSLSKPEIEAFKGNEASKVAQRVWKLINRPQKLLATILITNNLANVGAILVVSNIIGYFGDIYQWDQQSVLWEGFPFDLSFTLNLLISTILLLLFGEIVPKVYAAKHRLQMVSHLALPLDYLRRVLNPFSHVLINLTKIVDQRVQLKDKGASIEDLKHAIDLATNDEEHKDEKEILKGIVNFSNIPVKSIMRARVDVIAVDVETSLEGLVDLVNEQSFSRLPVYEDSLDQVLGVLHIKDLLPYLREEIHAINLKDLLRDAHFVPENKKIDSLLEEFKSRRLHLAIVVDEFGGTAGIVTLEDVIEEIFGEINDEFDSEDWVYTKLSDNTYIFEGRIALNDVKKIVALDEQVFEDARGDSETLGGLILELHGKIPKRGDMIPYHHFELHVESVSNNRIMMVKLVINEQAG